MERSEIVTLLRNEIVDLEFTKLNGDIRQMTCTLRKNSLPAGYRDGENIEVKNKDVCSVFDTISQGWRSFRWNSLISVNGVKVNE
jgi:hypothetical protein